MSIRNWKAFFRGFFRGATINFGPSDELRRLREQHNKQTVEEALASDWAAVYKDMEKAIEIVKEEISCPCSDAESPHLHTGEGFSLYSAVPCLCARKPCCK